MASRILIIDGHPDPDPGRLCRQLVAAVAEGGEAAGHAVRRIELATLDFPMLRTAEEFENDPPPPAIAAAQRDIEWANHLVMVFPIWLGTEPALVKAFLEQAMRPGFARERPTPENQLGEKRMTGRSVRIVATMGMPALAYRFWFMGHGLKNLSGNVLKFVGFSPVRWTLVGGVGTLDSGRAERLFTRMRMLGRDVR